MKSVLRLYFFVTLASGVYMEKAIGCAESCIQSQEKISDLKSQISRYEIMLKKNQDYLEKNANMEPSLRHKVKSNLFFIQTKLEFFSDNIELLSQQLSSDCKECKNGQTK